ncbi:nicotinate-nucleotide adenylyltransferase [Parvibaculum sp.]|uniref:nicotinate-nucleotide adenylyltransferase n=1 Tax=Parvibaculum sp. TaxID=2024848 RepID=UPI001D5CD62E|nr:nicotinate-nucleotide adenylyltransferase [Parvibaculum sp.]MBX3489525.1 nicotinate-nucleotide adenylyltransferase [Parvibaculum sp.]MCW5726519.1 nicotinate-nucleotide adenylyltransferase [Parvibaculum sp.]
MTRRRELLTPRMKVGLLGGSFNPAHEGHLHLTRMCLRALGLDRVWWLVSPQNPLKPETGMAPFADRFASAQAMARDPRICVSDIETRLGTRYTADTLTALRARHPDVRFVWLMGADNMIDLPRWRRWRDIAGGVPIAVYPRPGFTLKARLSPAAAALRPHLLDASDGALLADAAPPALIFLEGPESRHSATEIRSRGGWPAAGTIALSRNL